MKLYQSDFSAGEVSPDFYGRWNDERYKKGLKTCINAVVDQRGSVARRAGAKHVHTIVDTNEAKLFDFHYDRDESFVVAFSEFQCSVIEPDNVALGREMVVNYNFTGYNVAWHHQLTGDGTVDVQQGQFTLIPNTGTAVLHQVITLSNPEPNQLIRLEGLFRSAHVRIYSASGTNYLNATISGRVQEFSIDNLSTNTLFITITADNDTEVFNVISIKAELSPAGTWTSDAGVVPYRAQDVHLLHGTMAPNGKSMYFTHPDYPPYKLSYQPSTGFFAFNPVNFEFDAFNALSVVINPSSQATTEGDSEPFNITIQNVGGLDASNIIITVNVGAYLSEPTNISDGGVWSVGQNTITWNATSTSELALMTDGQAFTVSFTSTVLTAVDGSVNTVSTTIDWDEREVTTQAKSHSTIYAGLIGPVMDVTLLAEDTAIEDAVIIYNILVENDGDTDATGVTVVFDYPTDEVTYVNSSPLGVDAPNAGVNLGTVTWTAAQPIPPGHNLLLSVSMRVDNANIGMILQFGSHVSCNETDTITDEDLVKVVQQFSGPWTEFTRYPSTMTFFEGRSWWGGVRGLPDTFWGSVAGQYENLDQLRALAPALEFTLSKHGLIKWMKGGKNLLIGTEEHEFIVTSHDGLGIDGGNIEVELQSGYGSSGVQPDMIGNNVLFTSIDAVKVRQMWYQWTESGYLAEDITFTNDNINEGLIRDISFAKAPDTFIWLSQDSGIITGCTFFKEGRKEATYGWHRHFIREGAVLSSAVQDYEGNSFLWMAVKRVKENGNPAVHIEKLDTSNPVYLDSWVREFSNSPIDVITGLDHLEGELVGCTVDGAVAGRHIVAGGQITASVKGNELYAGLEYHTVIETLPVAEITKSGETASLTKHRSSIYLRVNTSHAPFINGEQPAVRVPANQMGVRAPLTSQDFKVHTLGWDKDASVKISTSVPLPFELAAIFGDTAGN